MVKNSRLMGQEELVLQTSSEENGKAALAMILACFGKTVTMEELGGPIHNAAELVSAAQEQGLAARGLRMTVEEVEKAPLPLIAHWRFRAFVVVTKVKGNRVWISSPEEGFLTLSRKEFQQGFTGVALCFALPGEGTPESSGGDSDGEKDKKPSAVQKPARKKAEKEEGGLKGMLPPAAWALLGVIQLFIAAGYGLLAILCRRLAMGLSAPQQVHGVGLCLFIAGLLLALGGAEIFQTWLVHRGQEKKRRESRLILEEKMEEINPARLRPVHPFRLLQGVRGYEGIPQAQARQILAWTRLLAGGFCLLWMAVQDAGAFGAAVVVTAVYSGVCVACVRSAYGEMQKSCLYGFAVQALAQEDLSHLEEAKLRGENISLGHRWLSRAAASPALKMSVIKGEGWYFSAALLLLLFVFGASLVGMLMGHSDTADLLGCMAMAAGAASAMGALPELLSARMEEKAAGEAIHLAFPRENPLEGAYQDRRAQSLTLQNVAVQPEGWDTPVRGVTFTLRRGEALGVLAQEPVGQALARVMAGLGSPVQGEVYLDSRDMAKENSQDVFQNVMMLGESLPFPQGTVRENIAAQKEDVSDQAVAEAASQALLHESILRHKDGYDTPVQELSRGERVLLEFARAFVRGTPFLICPGLTRGLSRETEGELLSSLRRQGIGIVLLTQDRGLLRQCDIACRIEKGRMTLRERGEFVEEEEDAYGNEPKG